MVSLRWARDAREQHAVSDLFSRLESGLRHTDLAAGLLQPIASFIGAETAAIRLVTTADPSAIPTPLALLDIPASVGDAYLGRFCELDPARKLPPQGHAGPVFADPDRPGQWRYEGSSLSVTSRAPAQFREYRRGFLMPFGLVHHAGFYLEGAGDRTLLFDFHRGRRARPFDSLASARMHVVARYLHARIAARWNPVPREHEDGGCAGTLSGREAEVARAVAEGLCNKAIAAELHISVRTVENHLRSIFAKLRVGSRTQLAARIHQSVPSIRRRAGRITREPS